MLVESLVTLSADSRSNSTAFDTSLKLCENLGRVLDQAESLLQKVHTSTHTYSLPCLFFFSLSSHYCLCRVPHWPTPSTTTTNYIDDPSCGTCV